LLDRKVDNSPTSSTKVKNLVYYSSIPPMHTGIHSFYHQEEIKSHLFPCDFTGSVI